jgi:3-oxoacyl-[acyl-carrier-protein] synthase II
MYPTKRRVVITGVGAVTPVGNTMTETWNGIIEGKKTVGKVEIFDAEKFSCNFAYQVRDFKLDQTGLSEKPELREKSKFLNRAGEFGWNASIEAAKQAGILSTFNNNPLKTAVCLGVGVGSPELSWHKEVYMTEKYEGHETNPYHRKYFPNTLSTLVASLIGAKGATSTIHTACASSGQALGEAYEMVACGDYDVVMTGGADSMVNPFQMAGFCLLGALSSRVSDPKSASRPFDADRDGFVLGEGACMFVFEEYEHAKKRGANIIGEICGYGVTESAYRITDLHPEGRGVIESMEMALKDAGISPDQVGYINAHGTSTLLNDKVESLAISKVFPKDSSKAKVSSTKSTTGHLISAAGALEFAVAMMSLKYQVYPPSVNLKKQDPGCDVTLTPSEPSPMNSAYALSNSVGFGGSNTSLVARRV